VEFNGVSIHKKALIYRALRTSMEFSRVYWSSIWWRRGEPTSLKTSFKPLF